MVGSGLEEKMDLPKTLMVGGRFDDSGGRPSKIASELFKSLSDGNSNFFNGGNYRELESILGRIGEYRLIYWFADVPNDKLKLVKKIKALNKESLLVTSKRNVEGRYSLSDLIYHALGIKSNLVLEFTKDDSRYYGRIIDPLGNVCVAGITSSVGWATGAYTKN